ncbi:10415_t:CDS:2 [Entrophospora sp. SA101]|nr:11778_t:CDS:2 [Entrophospora sp. SA101]CAJ0912332.1 10415_t:CDS:2 [Entrophospora sp. SA101]
MDGLQARFKYYVSQADKELSNYPKIVKLEQQTGIQKTYLAASVVGTIFVLIFFNIWGSLLSNLIGWLYPAYISFKAIESTDKADDTQWLTYWLFLPTFNGAKVVYAKGIRPFLLEYEYDVDKNISKLNKKVVDDVLDSSSSNKDD